MTDLVQPIIVVKDQGTHTHCVGAAALASVSHYFAAKEDLPVWQEWLSQSFTKTVRRASKTQLDKIYKELGGTRVKYGDSIALGLPPMDSKNLPKSIHRLQVSGFVRENLQSYTSFSDTNAQALHYTMIFVNSALGMTTGKAAAQAAHALWQPVLHKNLTSLSEILPLCVVNSDTIFNNDKEDSFIESETLGINTYHITDAGYTEVPPGSRTAMCVYAVSK